MVKLSLGDKAGCKWKALLTMSARWLSSRVKLCFPADASRLCWTTSRLFCSHTALLRASSIWNQHTASKRRYPPSPDCIYDDKKISNLVPVALGMFDLPLFPNFTDARWSTSLNLEAQQQNCKHNLHPEMEKESMITVWQNKTISFWI